MGSDSAMRRVVRAWELGKALKNATHGDKLELLVMATATPE